MFEENASGRKIYVPTDSVEAYKTAEGWSDYADAISPYDFINSKDENLGVIASMKYFNEVATTGDGLTYVLTGKITEVVNTTYGNFYFEDETGTAYVYDLLTPDGKAQTQWAAAGLKVNDIITVKGARDAYKGDPQMSFAIYVSHISAME